MKLERLVCACMALVLVALPALSASKRPYEVSDAVVMERPADISFDVSPHWLSPDGKSAFLGTSRGSLVTGRKAYAIERMATHDVLGFVRDPARSMLPAREHLIAIETATVQESPAISGMIWAKGGQQLIFIARCVQTREIAQVVAFDVTSRTLRQLTHAPGHVRSFDLAENAGMLVYAAETMPNFTERNRLGHVARGFPLPDLTSSDARTAKPEWRLFTMDLPSGRVRQLNYIPSNSDIVPLVTISPSGHWAVFTFPVRLMPPAWRDYGIVEAAYPRSAWPGNEVTDHDVFGHRINVLQIQLADLRTSAVRPLLDAPSDVHSANPEFVTWSPNEQSVVLSDGYLPLAGTTGVERSRRLQIRAAVEVDLNSGDVRRVTDVSVKLPDGTERRRHLVARWLSSDSVALSALGEPSTQSEHFRKLNGKWIRAGLVDAGSVDRQSHTPVSALELHPVESLSAPVEIVAKDVHSGAERTITDFGSGWGHLETGRLEVFRWTDRLARKWKGGLLRPSNFDVQRRYPLAIQTYGFFEDRFEVGGWTASPGRLFLAQDFLTLQLECETDGQPRDITMRYWSNQEYGEAKSFLVCVEGAIDVLDAAGVIDPRRVGMLGFSRTGLYVQHVATFSKHALAAASVVDSIQATPWAYALSYGYPVGMRTFDDPRFLESQHETSLIGAPLTGSGLKLWVERSPAFNVDKIRTPIRYEHHGADTIPPMWDLFALLRRYHRPAELVRYPVEAHDIQAPLARYTSQTQILDWFSFWLKGSRDPDPRKWEQYRRWSGLQQEQKLLLHNF